MTGSQRRYRVFPLSLVLLAVALVAGCAASPPMDTYRGSREAAMPEAELATVEMGRASWVIVDEVHVPANRYGAFKLRPGQHAIVIGWVTGVSVLVDPRGQVLHRDVRSLAAEPGGNYRIGVDRTVGHGYTVYFWIEDLKTGKVVSGMKKP